MQELPSAIQVVNELKAYGELKDKQIITSEQLKDAKEMCRGMATMCLDIQIEHWNQMVTKMEELRKVTAVPAPVEAKKNEEEKKNG
jgi:hypothetical protein